MSKNLHNLTDNPLISSAWMFYLHRMEISIDKALCIGAGQCAAFAEGVFDQDENGIAYLLSAQVSADRFDEVRLAAQLCPVSAIAIIEEGQ